MTVSILLLYTVTLSFPGSYHHEICETASNHPKIYKNFTIMPSFSTNTSTSIFNYHTSTRDLSKSVNLEGNPYFNSITMDMTQNTKIIQSLDIKPSQPLTTLTKHSTPFPTRSVPDSLPTSKINCAVKKAVSPSTPTDGWSKVDNSKDEMPNVVKYVTVFSLMAFAGGYSIGYGPGNLLHFLLDINPHISQYSSCRLWYQKAGREVSR